VTEHGLPGLSPLEMTVRAGDGLILKGLLEYPDGHPSREGFPLAVLAHQYPATSDSYAPLIEDLLDLGFAVLAFDERGHGSSIETPKGPLIIDTPHGFGLEAFGTAFGNSIQAVEFHRIADDVVRVASWGVVQNFVDPGRVLLVGASVGGSGVLVAAPEIGGLSGLLTFGAAGAPAFGEDAGERIRRNVAALDVPVLMTSSADDPFEGAGNASGWCQGLEHATALLVPGSAHAMAIYYDVRDDVLSFLRPLAE
jgi:pimeloyl-ACP methyl ester carboxylesterase